MADVVLENIWKHYGGGDRRERAAVRGISLQVKSGEFMVLVGPSGCGKSTTLRIIAGLEDPSDGLLKIAGSVVNDLPPKDRDIAMVFQNYALYPHMTVGENMGFALKLRKLSRAEIVARVEEAAALLGLTPLLQRKPKELSGGQRQRVALGRAIVRSPKVFLFDEPLSNLDAKMRVAMRAEICRLHQRLKSTMIYVTHDQVEAMTMGDRICVMDQGSIMQVGTPRQVYEKPANAFVAGFVGSPSMNLLRGSIEIRQDAYIFVEENASAGSPWELCLSGERVIQSGFRHGDQVLLGFRPEDVQMASEQGFLTRIQLVEITGPESYLHATTGTHNLILRGVMGERYEISQPLRIVVDPNKIHLFRR